MTAPEPGPMLALGPAVRHARWLALAVTVVFLLPSPIYTMIGYQYGGGGQGQPSVVVALATVIGAIHLWHSRGAAHGSRPTGWPATLLVLAVLVDGPMLWWGQNWAAMQCFLVASVLMLLPVRAAVPISTALIVGTAVLAAANPAPASQISTFGQTLYVAVFWLSWLALGGVALYGAARLVHIIEQLYLARADMAGAAVDRERLRVSRDLHDLLGQSLSAVSLKGDLALALLRRDPPAAHTEISDLTTLARDTLHGMRAVTRDEHTVGLRDECDGAAALLTAAGIDARIDPDPYDLPPKVERLFGWAVREGVTNILRHSDARTCSITTSRDRTTLRLAIINDGASDTRGEGTGLAGLTERAQELHGSVTAARTGGTFRLTVDVPRGQT